MPVTTKRNSNGRSSRLAQPAGAQLRWVALGSAVIGLGIAASCGGNADLPIGSSESSASGGNGGNVANGTAGAGAVSLSTGGSGGGCSNDNECDGGYCNNGTCCDSIDAACGDNCCGSEEFCLFDQCVLPGDDCVSAADCPPDHYCEPALGDNEGQGGAGANCTQPLEHGKCVPLPPTCDDEPNNPDCIENCEYQPELGQLNAVTKWQWGYDPPPTTFPDSADVWSTPAVGRIFDANCDGKVDLADPPNVVFVSGNSLGTYCSAAAANGACRKGVLRMLDGSSGEEVWSLDKAEPTSIGFAGLSIAIGDVDNDQKVDVVALTGEGKLAIIDRDGNVTHLSTEVVLGYDSNSFGWGGAIALGDMNNDGFVEIAYGPTVYSMAGGTLSQIFIGTLGSGGPLHYSISHFADVNDDTSLELVAGNTAYQYDGTPLWVSAAADGFTATGNFDSDPAPEIVIVRSGQLYIVDGATGVVEIGPHNIPGNGNGGPPTVADFNGDGAAEIGVAMQNFYTMMKPDYATNTIIDLWSTVNHDNSSSVTGSSVFDFEGDGKAEVVYMDECYLWVYDGETGIPRFSTNSQSFTATEASIVADVDGDGHAEMVVVHNAADPNLWSCAHHVGNDVDYPAWAAPAAGAYRGVTILGDSANSWVGTRTLWNQHAYSVSNICDPRDSACTGTPYYGQIPTNQEKNWTLPWLNNFRQNVQDGGLFDAPDPVVSITAACVNPVPMEISVRNLGLSGVPANVEVGIFKLPDVQIATVFTSKALFPGQTEIIEFLVDTQDGNSNDTYYAEILIDLVNPTFHECRPENNRSKNVQPDCVN